MMLLVDETSSAPSAVPTPVPEVATTPPPTPVPMRHPWRSRVIVGVRWLPRIVLNLFLACLVLLVIGLTLAPGYIGPTHEPGTRMRRGDRPRPGWWNRAPHPTAPQPPSRTGT